MNVVYCIISLAVQSLIKLSLLLTKYQVAQSIITSVFPHEQSLDVFSVNCLMWLIFDFDHFLLDFYWSFVQGCHILEKSWIFLLSWKVLENISEVSPCFPGTE